MHRRYNGHVKLSGGRIQCNNCDEVYSEINKPFNDISGWYCRNCGFFLADTRMSKALGYVGDPGQGIRQKLSGVGVYDDNPSGYMERRSSGALPVVSREEMIRYRRMRDALAAEKKKDADDEEDRARQRRLRRMGDDSDDEDEDSEEELKQLCELCEESGREPYLSAKEFDGPDRRLCKKCDVHLYGEKKR